MGGSPDSLLAPTLEPATVTVEPLSTVALAKLSLTGPLLGGGSAAWVTVNVSLPMVSVAVRGLVLVLAVTDQFTVPEPVPFAGVQVSQLVALLVAVQLQSAFVTTREMAPPSARSLGVAPDGKIVYMQGGAAGGKVDALAGLAQLEPCEL